MVSHLVLRPMHQLIFSTLIAIILSSATGLADTIEFPEEELATETVLPVFENQRGVLNRRVTTANRIEIGGGAGLTLNEAFFNPINFNLQATYHFDELHAINLMGYFFMDGLSQYGDQLRTADNLGQNFDATKGPAPSNLLLANYQIQAFYGKISLTKKSVINLALVGTLGAGLLGYDSGDAVPALSAGFGQKFYFTKNLALRFDFRIIGFQGPALTSQDLGVSDPEVPFGDFDEELFFNTYLSSSLVFLL